MKDVKLTNCLSGYEQNSEEGELSWLGLGIITTSLEIEAWVKVLHSILYAELGPDYQEPALSGLMGNAIEITNDRRMPSSVDVAGVRLSSLVVLKNQLHESVQSRVTRSDILDDHVAAYVFYQLEDLARHLGAANTVEEIAQNLADEGRHQQNPRDPLSIVSYIVDRGILTTKLVFRGVIHVEQRSGREEETTSLTTLVTWAPSSIRTNVFTAGHQDFGPYIGQHRALSHSSLAQNLGDSIVPLFILDFGAAQAIYDEMKERDIPPSRLSVWWAAYPRMPQFTAPAQPQGTFPPIQVPPPENAKLALVFALGAALSASVGMVSWRLIRNRFLTPKKKKPLTALNVGGPTLVSGVLVYLVSRLVLSMAS